MNSGRASAFPDSFATLCADGLLSFMNLSRANVLPQPLGWIRAMFSANRPIEMTITRMVKNTCTSKVNRIERMARYRQIMHDPHLDIKVVSADSLPSWLSLQAQKLVHEHPSALALGALVVLSVAIP